MYYLYIIYNEEADKFYIGSTSDLSRRLREHNEHRSKSRFTRKYPGTWILKHKEEFRDRKEALKREKFIKSQKSRQYIVQLINNIKTTGLVG